MKRILLLTCFAVAAFFCGRAQTGYALLMEDGGSLSVRNNVVVNNGDAQSNVNTPYNLFGHYSLFLDTHTDFHVLQPELIYNQGNNAYATWLYDMMGIYRQYNDTVDLGAYEYPHFVNYAVFRDYDGTLSFCNNVIINNFSGTNINVEVSADNYLTDGSDVFINDHHNFQPKLESPIVNAGSNSCASALNTDIKGIERVQNDTVEIGAFECHFGDVYFPVWQETGGALTLCNNIIINNNADSNVNVSLSVYNFVTNTDAVFLHNFANFTTQLHSVTVDAGDNSCVTSIATDFSGSDRVSNHVVDLGAFEVSYDRDYFPVFQETGGELHICNNIIMNNYADTNVNVTVENNNFLTDSADIFVHPYVNFRPKANIPTLDAGQNICATSIEHDLTGEERVQNNRVDIGAYEYRAPEISYPFLKEGTGDLHICNNIIINNYADSNINVTVDENNLVQDIPNVFVYERSLFMLSDSSVAIDAGSNACSTDSFDLEGKPRVENQVIDIGAFERRFWELTYGVYQEENAQLTFCNNIFSNNNSADSNVNVVVGPHNLTEDNDYIFTDKYNNFKLLNGSVAVDAGFNSCATWNLDLVDTARVLHEVIDLGAFELYVDDQRAVVFRDFGSSLYMCNNVVVLNSDFAPNVNFSPDPSSNIVNDLVEVFRDERFDYRPMQHSVAVDAGNNGCNGLPTDLDTVKRISNGCIDIGAFEIPERRDTNYAGGGGGGGGYGGGGGGGGYYTDPDYNAIVCQNNSSTLYLCNNIIVNNHFAASTNSYYGWDSLYRNIVVDTVPIFRELNSDFRLIEISPAVDWGRNDCNHLAVDIAKHDRVIRDIIDVGAFEFLPEPQFVAVKQIEEHQMTVCNNIIINNINSFSVNDMNTPGNNLLLDNNMVFRNNMMNYLPRPISPAVNHGNNDCCPLAVDLKESERIVQDSIDIGAFEVVHFSDSDLFVVLGKEGHQLTLCNNIIINNSGTNPVNDDDVSAYNLLVDHHDVFTDNELDYTPREHSIVINVGNNSCCPLGLDITDVDRIFADTIDLGAFEQSMSLEDSSIAVLQKEGYTLTLCNNIIVNNTLALSTNVDVDETNNIITNSDDLFVSSEYDYTPKPNSAAVNAGNNTCCPLTLDLNDKSRVYEEVIDIGAFEPRVIYDTTIALLGEETAGWTLCNNIIINNKYSRNLNIANIPSNNIVEDNDRLFVDNHYNYRVFPASIAVNAGSNSCVGWGSDMENNIRIYEKIVDIGAFEQYIDTHLLVSVLSTDTNALVFCNNIIINNKYSQNTNLSNIPENNIITDNDTLFVDNRYNYTPRPSSLAVNHGSNECTDWTRDMVAKARVFGDVIDVGAYEVVTAFDTVLYAVIGTVVIGGGGSTIDTAGSGGSGGGTGGGGSGGGTGGGGSGGDTGGGGSGSGTGGGGTSGDGTDSTNITKLRLYNNIVVYNPGSTNIGGDIVGDHNLLTDEPNVFADTLTDFSLPAQSVAVDAGDNQRVAWNLDIKDDARIACANIVDQGAYEHVFEEIASTTLSAVEVTTDNCQGFYIQLTATLGAQHYYWSHTNEDTNAVQVTPLMPTEYSVVASNGGECVDTVRVYVIPSSMMSDSLGAPASVGKKFYLSYLRNHFRSPTLSMNISAQEACTGTVRNPRTGWNTSFSVGAQSVTTVYVPVEVAYPAEANEVDNYGLVVETTDSVSLYAANYNVSSFDVTDVLPVDALSDEYVLQTYLPMMNSEFVIVATVDNTVVDITPSRALQGGHPAQHQFSVTLNAGQTYLGISEFGGVLGDLSGTLIRARENKPVAVFNGNVCALVPSDNSYTDHLVEQAVGVNYWGRSFAITTTESQNFDVVRVTALRDNTEIRKNGVLLTTLQAYQTHEFQITGTEGSCYLETSKPAGVYLYIAGAVAGNSRERSDPSMVWIPPTEQMMNDITFATFNSSGISDHYVNIVIPASSVDEVTLDGTPIGGQFVALNGSPNFMFLRKHIVNGTHTLHCDGGFIAHCYGLGYHESYGYAAGSKAVPLKEQLFVNGILNTELPTNLRFCPYEPIDFTTYANYPCDSVVWNFGDSTPTVMSNIAEVVEHGFAEAGTYTVTATLYITSNEAVFCSNLYAQIRVKDGPIITYYDTVCQGATYSQHGFEVVADVAGHQTHTRQVALDGQYCDSTFVLELEVRENHFIVEDTICLGNSYQEYGFNLTPSETGLYTDTIHAETAAGGCDSLVVLQLMVTPNTDTPPAIEGEANPCQGGTYTYSIDSLSGLQNVVWTLPDSVLLMPQPDPYSVTILLSSYADSLELCVSATAGCGEMNWCRTVYPQAYSYVTITDTLCANVTEYDRYGFTLTNVSDSNDLFINHNTSAGGCDSTTVLSLVFLPVYEVNDTISLCTNEFPYPYHDTILSAAGDYVVILPTVSGCDSTVNLTLLSRPTHHTTFDTTVCDQMVWFGESYTESGSYDTTLTNIHGCDSVVTMQLTVHYSDTVRVDSTICRDELPITWNGVTFTDAGVQSAHLQTSHGCDSMVVMTLHVSELTEETATVTVLENNMPYVANGHSYDSAGTYVQHLTNVAGCDSTLTLIINVMNNVENAVDSAVCENDLPLVWNGVTFNMAGAELATLVASTGADSIVVMNVTVKEVAYKDVYEDACDSMTWINGVTYYGSSDTNRYILTAANGCDSVVTLHLTITNTDYTVFTADVCDSLRWIDGNLYTESTNEPTFTLTNAAGCDSVVTLHLTITNTDYTDHIDDVCDSLRWIDGNLYTESTNEPTFTLVNAAGCDSVVTLNLTVRHSTSGVDVHDVCDSLRWIDGNLYTESTNEPIFTLTNAAGCDSVVTLNLTVRHSTTYTDVHDVCDSLRWIDGNLYTESTNDPTFTLPNAAGCDSIVTLNLTVRHSTTYVDEQSACDSLLWIDGTLYTESTNEPTFTLTNAAGCDSVVTLHLTITNTDYTNYTDEVCDSLRWIDGNLYTESTNEPTFTLTNAAGCDSVVTLNLTVRYSTTGVDTLDVCDSLRWIDGNLYTESTNEPMFTLQNAAGCDSVVTLDLTVRHSTTYVDVQNVCDSLRWLDGNLYTESTNEPFLTLMNAAGCDSVVRLNLTVRHSTEYVDVQTAIDSMLWIDGNLYTESTDTPTITLMNAAGCDSVVWLHLTVRHSTSGEDVHDVCDSLRWIDGILYTESTNTPTVTLINAAGCDSVVTLYLTVRHSTTYVDVQDVCDSLRWMDGNLYTESTNGPIFTLTNAAGCDSVVTLNLTVRHSTTYVDVQNVCDSLRWIDGNLYTESTYEPTYTLPNAAGCDSVVTLNLTVRHSTTYVDVQSVCDSLRWIDGILYVESTNEPTFTLTNVDGCDSVVALRLTVRHSTTYTDIHDVCDSLRWIDGNLYTESTYTPMFTLTNAAGCDSVVTLNLTVRHSTTYVDVYDVCDSLRWIDGNLYIESTNEPIFTLPNAAGCDSIVTLNLTVRHSTTYIDVQSACDSMRWIDGNLYTESTNEPTLLLTNAAGCDSLVILHLTITNTDYTDYTDEVCDSLRWIDGNLYTESTSEPTFTLTNVGGCDSVVRLNLTVRYSTSGVDIYDVCDSLRWIDGNLYTESTNTPTFTLTNAAGCDSVVTLHLTVRHSTGTTINAEVVQNNLPYVLNDSTYTVTGTYYQHFANAAGCDSTVTLNLTVYANTTAQVYATVCASALPYTWGGHLFAAAGTFVDTLLTGHGADSVVTYTLTVDEIAATIPNVTHVTCYGGSNGAATATVTGGMPNFAYTWTNETGASVSTSTSINNQPAGTYTFTVTDAIGCVATATVTLNTLNDALQPGTIAEDQVVCEGEQPLPFTGTAASGGDNGTYQWQVSANGTDWTPAPGTNNTQNYTYPNIPTAAFSLRRAWVSQSCGTEYSNTVNVTLWPNTIDTVTAAVCQNEAFEGFGFEVTADQTAAPGDYTFEQHHATGHCDSVVVLILTVNPLFETEVEDVVCEGEGYDDNGFSIAPMETVGEQQLTRTQTLQSVAGCDSVVTLRLRVIDTAVRIVSLTPDFCEDLSAELMVVTDMPNYVWSTGETAPSITVTHSGSYYVTASQGECSNTARFVIENCDDQLLLPNAITPSRNDGLNDYFSIPERNLRSINLFEIWIYNRWGELVYYSNDKNFHWNGEYRGEIQYQTIYNYVIRYTDAAGKPYFVKGSVTVL